MATAAAPPSVPAAGANARVKLMCSHGGRLVRWGPDDPSPRYVGGTTRVLAVARRATFRGLAARLSFEMAGGAGVRAFRYRYRLGLDDVIVSVTSDEELAHMMDAYHRLRSERPNGAFRVFVVSTTASGIPATGPITEAMRRVHSEQALAARAQLHRRAATYPDPAPMRRVQSAHPLFRQQCRCVCQRRNQTTAAASAAFFRPLYRSFYHGHGEEKGHLRVVRVM